MMRVILTENAVFGRLNMMISLAYQIFTAKNLNRPLWSNLIRQAFWGRMAYPETLTARTGLLKNAQPRTFIYINLNI